MIPKSGYRFSEKIMPKKSPRAQIVLGSVLPHSGVEIAMSNDTVTRIFGGSPLAVLGRLILVSILVGVVLSALGLDPFDIVHSIERLIRSIWDMGFDAVRWLWRYLLLGAVIVVPIWIVLRLINAPRGK
jgi:hypothetical protein